MERYITSQDQVTLYKNFRPSPPPALVKRVIDYVKESQLILEAAVDVGCGSGQSTNVLAPFFRNVFGIDNCIEQINEAQKSCSLTNISYRLGSCDSLGVANNSVQLVTAGQCAHFFELPKFYQEVDRVLQKNGVLAIYGYCLPIPVCKNVSLEHIVKNVYESIDQYVSDGSRLVYLGNYKTKGFERFPFSNEPTIREEFDKTIEDASVDDLLGYAKSWSTFQRLKNLSGDAAADDVISGFKNEILSTINRECDGISPEDIKLSITFRYFLLLGRKNEAN